MCVVWSYSEELGQQGCHLCIVESWNDGLEGTSRLIFPFFPGFGEFLVSVPMMVLSQGAEM